MQAGKLRHRILIQQPVETFTTGQRNLSYQDVGYFWGEVEAQQTTEPTQNDSIVAVTSYEVTMRHQNLTADHRLIWDSKVLQLVGPPIPDPRKRQIVCNCISRESEQAILTANGTGSIVIRGTND